ncbi:MAG: adenosylcobinamide-GDP ribazoletransferase, partial [Methanoregulaceae archaeon]|nr:adenosylcobinamide-GDP ribazoletransferase [Methanoregulaceae archaeon]
MKSIRSLLQFCTILPLGEHADFDQFACRSYLYPIAGYVIGGLTALLVFWVRDPPIAAGLAIASVLILSGCHHFDGLLDLGDGLMAHGSREKRISALTDRQIGAGGVAAGIIILLLTFA